MKKLILFLFLALASIATAQLTTTNPDTVCYQTTALSTYQVPSIGTGTYTWTIPTCATLVSGQGTNSIQVNWSACPPGLINNAISVAYTSTAGCSATPVTLSVLIYQVVPVITPVGPFCSGAPCVTLTATPTGGVFSGTGVTGNQFCPGVTNSLITYTYTNGGCTFTANTGAVINPVPVLSPIQHN
jgi:hypothetical protein